MDASSGMYTAVYSGVPVLEMEVEGTPVMRRRDDGHMNATQILKVAGIDKGRRTKILEREVHQGTHEKIQGGYGKYQGTWVPLDRSRKLAETYNVFEKLRAIIDFDLSSENDNDGSRLRTKDEAKAARRKNDAPNISSKTPSSSSQHYTTTASPSSHHLRSPSRHPHASHTTSTDISRKKRKTDTSLIDDSSVHHHSSLLASILEGDQPEVTMNILKDSKAPNSDINQPIDGQGRTLLHLASSLARVKTASELAAKGANIGQRDSAGETPLMHAVMAVDSFDSNCFPELLALFRDTIPIIDADGRTVVHHASMTAGKDDRVNAALYYMKHILKFAGNNTSLLNSKDIHGNTALSIAARLECNGLVDMLVDAGASTDLENSIGLTLDDYRSKGSKAEIDVNMDDNLAQPTLQYDKSPRSSSQRGREIVATVQKIVDALDEEYGGQLTARDSELKQLTSDLKDVGVELEKVRGQLEERQAQSQRLAETKQKSRNLSAAIDFGWERLKELCSGKEIIAKEAIDDVDDNEDIDKQFDVSLTEGDVESRTRQLRARVNAYTLNNDSLQSQITKLRDEVAEKEMQCKRLIAACCNLPIDRIDDVVEPLTQAIESDPPDLDLSRVIGFMDKIKQQGTFGDSEFISTPDHNMRLVPDSQ